MYVVMVAPECAPMAKVGGLGDVVQGLSSELALRGHGVELVLPKYDCMRYEHIHDLHQAYTDLWVPFHDQWVHCDVWYGNADGLNCFFIEPHSHARFFERGKLYGDKDDNERFAFFSRAAMEFLFKAGKHPDIIHCHDWQTGLVPVLLFELYQHYGMTHPRVCYTIHNAGHQGVAPPHVLPQVGLDPAHLVSPERLQDHTHGGAVNLMKGGIVYANFVTTVSPRHAGELKHSELGEGLQQVLNVHGAKFGGVLNGLDYRVWNPEIDPHIPSHFSVEHLPPRFGNKDALRRRLMLREDFKPLIGVVSRLDRQKGPELVEHAARVALARDCQFVLLGSATEPAINDRFWALKAELNDHPDCHIEVGYDEGLAHLIYAGSDMLVIPSLYEPCGLTQMIAMRYGAVPVARATGGLADTVFDANHSERPFHERNGYVFHDYSPEALESAMDRAIGLWRRFPAYFRQLRVNGMACDWSWNHPGQNYENIYRHIAV